VGLDHFALLETNLSVSTFAAGIEMVADFRVYRWAISIFGMEGCDGQ
jgi:hypothetical protein